MLSVSKHNVNLDERSASLQVNTPREKWSFRKPNCRSGCGGKGRNPLRLHEMFDEFGCVKYKIFTPNICILFQNKNDCTSVTSNTIDTSYNNVYLINFVLQWNAIAILSV